MEDKQTAAAQDRVEDASTVASSAAGEIELIGPSGTVDRDALFALYERQAAVDDETPVRVEFTLLKDLEKRLDRYLVDRVPFLSRTQIQRLIEEAAVTVNGRTPKCSTKLRIGDHIVATLPPPPSGEIQPEDIPLDVLFEDDAIIVVNKPAGLIVHPARSHKTGTLINALAWRFKNLSGGALSSVGEEFARPGVVHRLDKWTSGAIVAAKNDTAHWRLGKQFEMRRTDKRYLALVHGEVPDLVMQIDAPLGKHVTIKEKYAVRHDETGKASLTICRVRERFTLATGEKFTLVELELKTGRTHQIRVHMSWRGYPVVGDDMYGGKHVTERDVGGTSTTMLLARQALHATTLGIRHPMTDVPMSFTAPVAADFRRALELLRGSAPNALLTPAGATIDLASAGV
ncbi:MAG: RluA family pseudouridine synthase [Phycisphaerales bacterium]|nr:RluA family pseudouridine synthase [Phycisphaerales bacterium]